MQKEKEESIRLDKEIIKYIGEFDYRISQIEFSLNTMDSTKPANWVNSLIIWRTTTGDSAYKPIFNEFYSVPMLYLVTWFQVNTYGRKYENLDDAFIAIRDFPEYPGGYSSYNVNDVKVHLDKLKKFSQEIHNRLDEKNWLLKLLF